jgi:hypothetical protein
MDYILSGWDPRRKKTHRFNEIHVINIECAKKCICLSRKHVMVLDVISKKKNVVVHLCKMAAFFHYESYIGL